MMLKHARRVTAFETAAAEISLISPAGAQGFGKTAGADAGGCAAQGWDD